MKDRLQQGHYVASTGHTRLPPKRAVKNLQKQIQEQTVKSTNNRDDIVGKPCLIRRIQQATVRPSHLSHITKVGTKAQVHRNGTSSPNLHLPGVFEKRLRRVVRALFTLSQRSSATDMRHGIQLQAVNEHRRDGSTPRTHEIEFTDESPKNVKHSSRFGGERYQRHTSTIEQGRASDVSVERLQKIMVERRERIVPSRSRTQGNPNRHLDPLITARTGRTQRLAVNKSLHRLQKHARHVRITRTPTLFNRTRHGLQLCSRSGGEKQAEIAHKSSCRVVFISGVARRNDLRPADTDRAPTIGKKTICLRR